jgi:hypothetical protein
MILASLDDKRIVILIFGPFWGVNNFSYLSVLKKFHRVGTENDSPCRMALGAKSLKMEEK